MKSRMLLSGCMALALASAGGAGATSLDQFLAKLPSDNDASFKAANVIDLSAYQTMSKWQEPLGSCTVFSIVGAVEAAYTHKYCDNKTSNFYKAGYCQRYEALKAAKLKPFALVDNAWLDSDKKALDLSEQYFLNRVLSMWVTSPASNHESGNLFCFLDGVQQGVAGDTAFVLNNLTLPEESQVPYIYDKAFYDKATAAVLAAAGALASRRSRRVEHWDRSSLASARRAGNVGLGRHDHFSDDFRFVVVFAALRLKQPATGRQKAGLLAAFAASALVAFGHRQDFAAQGSNVSGAAWMLLSAPYIAYYYVWSVGLTHDYGTPAVAAWSTLFGFVALLPAAGWEMRGA